MVIPIYHFPELRIELTKEQNLIIDKIQSVDRKIYILKYDAKIYGWTETDKAKLKNLKKERLKLEKRSSIRLRSEFA